MNAKQIECGMYMMFAVETGDQVYGKANYADITKPYNLTANETAITIGAGGWFACEARQVLEYIRKNYASTFKSFDKNNLLSNDIDKGDNYWNTYCITSSDAQYGIIKNILSSTNGIKAQQEYMQKQIKSYIPVAEKYGVTESRCQFMFIETMHLGGESAAKRIMNKCTKPYTYKNFYNALLTDPYDGNYVGSNIFRSRHKFIVNTLESNKWPADDNAQNNTTTNNNITITNTSNYGGKNMISNSGHDENNSYSGGKAGDQTGTEWQIINWYNRPWDYVLRHPDANVREWIAKLGEEAANNDMVGYDQGQRYTYWTNLADSNYRPSQITVACESDCSAGVSANAKAVGYLLNIQKLKDISIYNYTGSMVAAFKAAGFEILTASKYLTSPDYLLRGDILLNEAHHTATNLTTGSKATTSNTTTNTNNNTSSTSTIKEKVTKYIYAKAKATVRTWYDSTAKALTSYPSVAKGTKLGYCDTLKDTKGKEWYFVMISGTKGDKYGFILASDTTDKAPSEVSSNTTAANTVSINGNPAITLSDGNSFNKISKFKAKVTASDFLAFRQWCSTDADQLISVPKINSGQTIDVCDAIMSDSNELWYYVKYKNVYGFVYGKYVKKS